MSAPSHVSTWPSLAELPALYPDARNRDNRGPALYRAGKSWPLDGHPDAGGRIALLAVGSNAYPRQLADKLAGAEADLQGVPILPAILRGLDAAFCPIRSRKGYVPVTLAERRGAVCLSWLQWLTPGQLQIISTTEGARYSLVGGPALAQRVRLAPQLQRPHSVYAWWFDSVLQQDAATAWMDVYQQQRRQQSALPINPAASRRNPVPYDWRVIHRDPQSRQIAPETMSQL